MKKILVLHGINLNMMGKRDPVQYGTITLDDINNELVTLSQELGYEMECFQTNCEGEMASRIHRAHEEGVDAVIINAGAWTHYSYGISDALAILEVPILEVHMSNIHSREEWRHVSVFSHVVNGQICGFGVQSYRAALKVADDLLKEQK